MIDEVLWLAQGSNLTLCMDTVHLISCEPEVSYCNVVWSVQLCIINWFDQGPHNCGLTQPNASCRLNEQCENILLSDWHILTFRSSERQIGSFGLSWRRRELYLTYLHIEGSSNHCCFVDDCEAIVNKQSSVATAVARGRLQGDCQETLNLVSEDSMHPSDLNDFAFACGWSSLSICWLCFGKSIE